MRVDVKEAHVIINGVTLDSAQSMTLRVALEAFDSELAENGLGNDAHGFSMAAGYRFNIARIRKALYASASAPTPTPTTATMHGPGLDRDEEYDD